MDMKQMLIRVWPEVAEAVEVLKERDRMAKSVICENALRDYLSKKGIQVTQPMAD